MSVRLPVLALMVMFVWAQPQVAGGTVQRGAVEFGVSLDAFTLDQAYIGTEPIANPGLNTDTPGGLNQRHQAGANVVRVILNSPIVNGPT